MLVCVSSSTSPGMPISSINTRILFTSSEVSVNKRYLPGQTTRSNRSMCSASSASSLACLTNRMGKLIRSPSNSATAKSSFCTMLPLITIGWRHRKKQKTQRLCLDSYRQLPYDMYGHLMPSHDRLGIGFVPMSVEANHRETLDATRDRVFNMKSQIFLFLHKISSRNLLHPTGFPPEFNCHFGPGFVGLRLQLGAKESW